MSRMTVHYIANDGRQLSLTGFACIFLQVFVSDKRKQQEFGGQEPFSRLQQHLLREAGALGREDRVLILGCSSQPYLCIKRDMEALLRIFNKQLYVPIPDDATRQVNKGSYGGHCGGRVVYAGLHSPCGQQT